jgi:hypothetical protein
MLLKHKLQHTTKSQIKNVNYNFAVRKIHQPPGSIHYFRTQKERAGNIIKNNSFPAIRGVAEFANQNQVQY